MLDYVRLAFAMCIVVVAVKFGCDLLTGDTIKTIQQRNANIEQMLNQ